MLLRMIRWILPILLAFISSASFASGGGHGSTPAHGEDAARPAGVPSLDLPPFMAPVTVDGELRFYVYMVIKVDLTSDFKKPIVLEKVPYIQDAILRSVHQVSIASKDDPDKVDEAGVLARLKPVVEKVVGPDVVAQLGFRNIARARN